jgi:hypothetical protein
VESLFEDEDFRTKVTREEFELLCQDLIDRVDKVVKDALSTSQLTMVSSSAGSTTCLHLQPLYYWHGLDVGEFSGFKTVFAFFVHLISCLDINIDVSINIL